MKKILTIVAIVILIINSISGLVLSSYSLFNWLCADVAIILGLVFHLVLNKSSASDGMKISFNLIISFFTIISFLLAVVMPSNIKNNLIFIFLIISISIQILIGIIPKYFTALSNSNK